MIVQINDQTLRTIRNPVLASYAQRYQRIAQNYQELICQSGIDMAPLSPRSAVEERREQLQTAGATFRSDGRSVVVNCLSPACEACRLGVGTVTFFISLKCHRSCFYCFNPNQEDYPHYRENPRNPALELEQMHASKYKAHTLALTGGEPLLFKEQTYAFFRAAARLYPDAHTRLYTCGDHADEQTLLELQAAGLDEIRFSIRMHDSEKSKRHTYERIALARGYIPKVMVEMPVLPGTLDEMKAILLELERLEIHSINLLEFCYPFYNAEGFKSRGYTVKNPPHRVLYDYWYAGGLPIQGSEEVCLDLIAFAMETGLKIGVHYCSLENKHTGQLYQQNAGQPLPKSANLSARDFLLKSAKVFGKDVELVQRAFRSRGFDNYTVDTRYQFIEFPVTEIPSLQDLPIEIGISSAVIEYRDGQRVIRELGIELTTPQQFDLALDL